MMIHTEGQVSVAESKFCPHPTPLAYQISFLRRATSVLPRSVCCPWLSSLASFLAMSLLLGKGIQMKHIPGEEVPTSDSVFLSHE